MGIPYETLVMLNTIYLRGYVFTGYYFMLLTQKIVLEGNLRFTQSIKAFRTYKRRSRKKHQRGARQARFV
ncbi:21169_t:CDS:2 [Cetraspora pellucida]|uniref:21169_t:CDS:1 n=1 Tax=Cetraspora pellucida TaxID=1433469 RepID=A0A9N8VXI5_9GLOM|nr:21169_t:CDS:2 [Cetraspora pellucida]